jgi:hypothetical protein
MRVSRFSLLPIALCLVHAAAWPQVIHESYPAEGYLPALVAAERATSGLLPAAVGNTRTPGLEDATRKLRHEFQALGMSHSFIGDTEGAIAAFDLLERVDAARATAKKPAVPDGVEAEDAIRASSSRRAASVSY